MKKITEQKVMQGAFILSVAAIIAKILSAVYRIPLQNLVGNTGFYVYQQIYPIYGIGMTFALNGYPNFISKIIAEEPDQRKKLVLSQYSLMILAVLSVTIFLVLVGGAHPIAQTMGDPQLAPMLRVVATMFLLMPLLATGRGYYQGIYDVLPTAKSQVVEQVVRVSIIILVAILTVRQDWSVYKMGAYAMASSTVAAVAASWFFIPVIGKIVREGNHHFKWSVFRQLGKRFIVEGGLICLLSAMIILLQLVDSFTVKNSLVASGMLPGTAKALKGVYDRAQPLVQVGTVIATAFATTLLPSLTEALQKRDTGGFYRSATSLIRVAVAISTAASVGMIALMPFINRLLFGSSTGSGALAIYNLSIILAAMIFVNNSVLQSMGRLKMTFWAIFAGLCVKVLCNGWAVRHWSIDGASWVTVLSLAIIAFAMSWALPARLLKRVYLENHFLLKLLVGNAIMFIVVQLMAGFLHLMIAGTGRGATLIITAVATLMGALTWLSFVLINRVFTLREWLTIPFGKKIIRTIQRMVK
ncbi:polysaccharide biosynthesis protein [Pediococcus acidilactici]